MLGLVLIECLFLGEVTSILFFFLRQFFAAAIYCYCHCFCCRYCYFYCYYFLLLLLLPLLQLLLHVLSSCASLIARSFGTEAFAKGDCSCSCCRCCCLSLLLLLLLLLSRLFASCCARCLMFKATDIASALPLIATAAD